MEFQITGTYIELIRLLKATGLAENGAHAKDMVMRGEVRVNGSRESRKRAKIYPGDVVELNGTTIQVQAS